MAESHVVDVRRVAAVLMSDATWHDLVIGSFRIVQCAFSAVPDGADRMAAMWVESAGRVQQTVYCPMEWIQGFRYAEETIDNESSRAERL